MEEGSSISDWTKKEEALQSAAKSHIEEIRTQKFSVGGNQPNPLSQDLHRAVTNLSKQIYQKDANFLTELIMVFSTFLFNVLINFERMWLFIYFY